MVEKLTTKNCIIACQDGLIYSSPAHVPSISSCNISSAINVAVDGMSTSFTFQEPTMSNSISTMASVTFFGCVGGIDIDNSNPFSKSLILNKTLQFVESPLVNPFIISSRDSNSAQIFHNNNISFFERGNNRSTYVMVSPSDEPSPSSRKFFQLFLGTLRAFRLKPTNKSVSFFPQGFNFVTIKNILGSDSEIIHAQVHPKNFRMLIRSFGIFLGECKSKIMLTSGLSKKAFSNFPVVKIIKSVFGNRNRDFNSPVDSGNTQNIILERETSRRIISDRNIINDRNPSFTFQYTTSHLNTGDSELRRQSCLSQRRIDEGMEFDIVFNSKSSSILDTILKPLFIEVDSIDYDFINFYFNRNASNQHKKDSYFDFINVIKLNNSVIPSPNKLSGLLTSDKILMIIVTNISVASYGLVNIHRNFTF